jgi:hypothetical protein
LVGYLIAMQVPAHNILFIWTLFKMIRKDFVSDLNVLEQSLKEKDHADSWKMAAECERRGSNNGR